MRDRTQDLTRKAEQDALAAAQSENAALRRRLSELAEENAALRKHPPVFPDNNGLLRQILEQCPARIFIKDCDGRYLVINRTLERLFGVSSEEARGKDDHDFWPSQVAEILRKNDQAVMKAGTPLEHEEETEEADGPHTYLTRRFPVFDGNGDLAGVCGIAVDITDRQRARKERARAAVQHQLAEAQFLAPREPTSSLIPLADGVVVLPLTEGLEPVRVRQLMSTLLAGVPCLQAHTVILDLTGVQMVDRVVAQALLQTARAASQSGVQVLLTGVSARAAQTLVRLRSDLSSLITLSTLQDGLAFARRNCAKATARR